MLKANETKREKTILLVEDDLLMRQMLQPYLKRRGFQAMVAENGARAVELIMKTPPDALVLDIMMPEMDGLAVLRLLRSTDRTKLTPVIVTTARYDQLTRDEMRKSGATSFLTKPFGPGQLAAEIERVLCPGETGL